MALVSGMVAAVLAAIGELPHLYIGQVLAGLSQGAAQAILLSALAPAVPPDRLGRTIGAQVMATQTGLLIGPALAGLALAFVDTRSAFALSVVPLAVALPVTRVGVDPRPSPVTAQIPLPSALRSFARADGIMAAALFTVVMTAMWGTQNAFLPLFAQQELHLGPSLIGLILTFQALTTLATRIPAGWILDRTRERRRIYFAGACVGMFALGLAVVPHTTAAWQLALLVSIVTPILGTASVALPALFARLGPLSRPGMAMGVYALVNASGSGLGPAVFGPAMTRGFDFGYTAAALACSALVLGTVAVQAWSRRSVAWREAIAAPQVARER